MYTNAPFRGEPEGERAGPRRENSYLDPSQWKARWATDEKPYRRERATPVTVPGTLMGTRGGEAPVHLHPGIKTYSAKQLKTEYDSAHICIYRVAISFPPLGTTSLDQHVAVRDAGA